MRLGRLALVVVFGLAACEQPITSPELDQQPSFGVHHTVDGPASVEGTTRSGAQYAMFLPEGWNRELVLFAHGYQFPGPPPALPEIDELRDGLLELGYGVAYSSFSETGWAIRDGLRHTRQLQRLYRAEFGRVKRTYLIGESMGGLISVMAVERYPRQFAGAMTTCGAIGGTKLEMDYFGHSRVLFDHFYPGVVPGSPIEPPDVALDLNTLAGLIAGAVFQNPADAAQIAAIEQSRMPYNDFNELLTSLVTAVSSNVAVTPDLLARQRGRNAFDNSATDYAGSFDDETLNAEVARYSGARVAAASQRRWYEPRGKLRRPVLAVHTTRDPLVPAFHMDAYHEIVAAAGRSELFAQRRFDRFGHCNFTLEEQLTAFQDLVSWVETGVAPAP